MMRWVIRDYVAAFRWQNVKERFKNGGWYYMINFLIILPFIASSYDVSEKTLACFLLNFVVAFSMFTSVIFPMVMPKMMYLCPISSDMRREYIVKACMVRMAVPILIGLSGIIYLYVREVFDWIYGVSSLLNIAIFSIFIGSGINTAGYGGIAANGQRELTIDSTYGLQEMVLIIITVILNVVYVATLGEGDAWWVKAIIIGVTLLIPLPITVSYMKHWPDAVERAMKYETCMPR